MEQTVLHTAARREPRPGVHHSTAPRTPVAVLGTLAEFHREPIPYDLAALVRLVAEIRPDLLCLDVTPDRWQHRDFSDLPPEYAEALLPLAHQTDMVVVPVAGQSPPPEPMGTGWRRTVTAFLRRLLAYLQRSAPGPSSVNAGIRHSLADLLYTLIAAMAGGNSLRVWREHTDDLVERVLEVVRRDPGRRVLVAVNVRHCHHIRHGLQKHSDIRVVRYSELGEG